MMPGDDGLKFTTEIRLNSQTPIILLTAKSEIDSKIEGQDSNDWKLVDGIDLIVHIFHPEKRRFYELEKMWSELIPKEKLII